MNILSSLSLEKRVQMNDILTDMRISIVGLPGSGKTTLAERLSKKLRLPHVHIDRFWLEAGGLTVSRRKGGAEYRQQVHAKVRARALEAHMADSWVSDGFYTGMVPEITEWADRIIYLKIPLGHRLLNHAKRMVHPNDRHPELNWWSEIIFFYEIVRRDFVTKPKLEQYVETNKNKVTVLKSFKEVDAFVNKF